MLQARLPATPAVAGRSSKPDGTDVLPGVLLGPCMEARKGLHTRPEGEPGKPVGAFTLSWTGKSMKKRRRKQTGPKYWKACQSWWASFPDRMWDPNNIGEDYLCTLHSFSPEPVDSLIRDDLYLDTLRLYNELMSCLSDRDQAIIVARFGLENESVASLEELGRRFNVTRERIRQLETKAIQKLQHAARCFDFDGEDSDKAYLNRLPRDRIWGVIELLHKEGKVISAKRLKEKAQETARETAREEEVRSLYETKPSLRLRVVDFSVHWSCSLEEARKIVLRIGLVEDHEGYLQTNKGVHHD